MFLEVPVKKTSEIDLRNAILRYIKDNYNEDVYDGAQKPVSTFHNLRNIMLSKLSDSHENTLNCLKEYHDSLLSLESRIPIAENGATIQFKWQDAFSEKSFLGKKEIKSPCGAFERLCVLFCIGSISSQLGAAQSLNSDEGLQLANKLFQAAAGMFQQIRLALPSVFQGEPTFDLKPDTLMLLTTIMIAQSQETIYRKAEYDSNIKSAIVAKLASQTCMHYQEANRLMALSSVKGKMPKDWSTHLAFKQAYFEAITNIHQAEACVQDGLYGERLARLKLAHYQASKNLSKEFKETKPLQEKLKNLVETAEKENNCIYHEQVPDAKNLKAVPGASLAKPTEVQCPLSGENFQDSWSILVPMNVQMLIDSAQKVLSDLISDEVSRLKEATDTCNCMIASLNLGTLNQEEGEIVPKSILEASEAFIKKGGFSALQERSSGLPDSRQRNIEILNTIRASIDDEENSDINLKSQFGDKWSRKPSAMLNAIWRNEIKKYDEVFAKTKATDEVTMAKFHKSEEALECLSLNKSELIKRISSVQVDSSSPQPAGPSQLRENVKSILSRLDAIKADRNDLITQLKEIKLPGTLRDAYLKLFKERGTFLDSNGEIAREHIVPSLEGPRAFVRESLESQSKLLEELQQASSLYFGKNGAVTDARSTLLTNLMLASELYETLFKDIEQGIKFYADATNVLMKIQQKVDDFVFARKTEKDELMNDINTDISRASIDPAPAMPRNVPPERPPPLTVPASAPMNQPAAMPLSAPAPQATILAAPAPAQPGSAYPGVMPGYGGYSYGYPPVYPGQVNSTPYPVPSPGVIQPPPLPYSFAMPYGQPYAAYGMPVMPGSAYGMPAMPGSAYGVAMPPQGTAPYPGYQQPPTTS